MSDRPSRTGSATLAVDLPGLEALPAASSLMSSRWSRDNLVTSHPARLYDGAVAENIELENVEQLVQELVQTAGLLRAGACRMGVFTWEVACESADGPLVLQLPRALDQRGSRGRARSELPRLCVENARHFAAQGLTRYAAEPKDLLTLGSLVPAALFSALPGHRRLLFGRGSLQVEAAEGTLSWLVALGPERTAELLAEMVAALSYHYEPELDAGTALTDVSVNDGDFVVRRHGDGAFDLRLTALRRREPGIGPSLLLLYLVQLMAYEDFDLDGALSGLPVLMSNPSVAFEGLVRGRRYRKRDLGLAEDGGRDEALGWIEDFGRSREGRAYRPWVERFLRGELPLAFGRDLRERWWHLIPLSTRLGVSELRARIDGEGRAAQSLRSLKALHERLCREIGRLPADEPGTVRLNDLGGEALAGLLHEAGIPAAQHAEIVRDLCAHWPVRSFDHLLANVPGARGLRKLKARLSFGAVVAEADYGTLKSLGVPPKEATAARPLANHELFGATALPPSSYARAVRTFPTFEAYMDAALHDPAWGYYGHGVAIGATGHFQTHPESLSPHYGRWIADLAFRAFCEMLERAELSATDPFPVVEFGAGNGRLARDILDAVAKNAADSTLGERPRWQDFAARLDYRIYETSASLRAKQRALVGERARIAEGDARRPEVPIGRDFPGGLRGLVVTNEVPDAFGVHKVVLTAGGRAFAALVLPRAERELVESLAPELARRIRDGDATLRATFDLHDRPAELHLDAELFQELMIALAALPAEAREALLARLWFGEAYVPASELPELARHLRANAAEYGTALAAEDSGVVAYVNVHASDFVRGIGSTLSAGFIVTIDYGDTTWGLVQGARRGDFPFRVYGDWRDYQPRPNDPYSAPGTQDLTADVNFTDLAGAGREVGLEVVHYGRERNIAAGELGEALRIAPQHDTIAKFLGNPVFKLLVLGTRASAAFEHPLATALPLFAREQDLPKARRALIAPLRAALLALESRPRSDSPASIA